MFQLHKITASALIVFLLISGIFAPYGSSYPFFSVTNPYMIHASKSKEIKLMNLDESKELNKTKEHNKTNDFNNSKNVNSKLQNNEICFENDSSQKKLLDFGTSLLLCLAIFIIINMHSKFRINQKLLGIPNLSLDMISYIHKVDGKKDKLTIL